MGISVFETIEFLTTGPGGANLDFAILGKQKPANQNQSAGFQSLPIGVRT